MAKGKKPQPWMIQRAIKRSRRNCAAKKVFKTIAEADAFAKQFNGHQTVYPCRVCGEYHLTTQHAKE